MSASSRILGCVTYLIIQSVCVFSFPGPDLLSPRQSGCNKWVCPYSLDNFVGGAGDLWNDGLGVAGWVIDKATGLLVLQPVESESGKNPNNANIPVADPMDQPGSLNTPLDQCTATSDSNPNDGSGQVSHYVQLACSTYYKHMLIPGLVQLLGICQHTILWASHTAARVGIELPKRRREFSFGSHIEGNGQ